ncbi:hypothetical protein AXG93_4360s1200 [Marchantia polymorpha subsp. ruderalis]|uniref:Uncharacterized protein n=1 Tax=Marchantia polymorpha subsp. ruderalis TaxID=1480154 RepID=A0A176W3W9_MARPO|nr:hypothetical protein AXG93_4360s1200 [Marchantia polymorpha subsp. ruderalis]
MLKTKSILLTILDIKCETGVRMHIEIDLFEYLKHMGRHVVTRVLNVTNDNGSDTTNAILRLFQPVNVFVGYEQLRKCNHVKCADYFVQLAVLEVLKLIRQPTEQLHNDLVKMRRSKVIRQQYQIKASRFDTIMDQYKDDIGHGVLQDLEWQIHICLVLMISPEGCAVGSLPYGNGLSRDIGNVNVNVIRARE